MHIKHISIIFVSWLLLEYLIPGTASPLGGCNFTYLSTSKKRGEFNSPRYPSRYPSNITCTYNFLAAPNEQTKLYFDQFKVRANGSINTYGSVGTYFYSSLVID